MTLASKAIGSIKNWWWFIIKGLLFIIAGVAVLSRPVEGYVGLSILFSVIILGIGISQLVFSVSNRQWLPGWGWLFTGGILLLILSFLIIYFPVAGAVGIIACSGAAFLVAGVLTIILAFKFRDIKETVRKLV